MTDPNTFTTSQTTNYNGVLNFTMSWVGGPGGAVLTLSTNSPEQLYISVHDYDVANNSWDLALFGRQYSPWKESIYTFDFNVVGPISSLTPVQTILFDTAPYANFTARYNPSDFEHYVPGPAPSGRRHQVTMSC
jgi:hypothetical protein